MRNNWAEIYEMAYTLVYAHASPPTSFKKLVDEAQLDEYGRKLIPFMDYEISEYDFDLIIDEVSKHYKLKKQERKTFEINMNLGPTPRFKENERIN